MQILVYPFVFLFIKYIRNDSCQNENNKVLPIKVWAGFKEYAPLSRHQTLVVISERFREDIVSLNTEPVTASAPSATETFHCPKQLGAISHKIIDYMHMGNVSF